MLSKWDGRAAAGTAHEIGTVDRQSIERIADAQQLLDVARTALDAVPTDGDGHTVTEIATFSTLLESLPGLAAQRDGPASDAARARRELDALEERLTGATKAAAKSAKAVDALQASRTDLADVATTAAGKLAPAQADLKEARRAGSRVTGAEERLRTAEAAVAELVSELEGARATHSQAKASHEATAAALEKERRAAAAAEAGHGLHGGIPCPVCDRELPDAWKPLAAPDLDAAREAFDESAKSLELANAGVIRHEGFIQAAEAVVASGRQEFATANELATAALNTLADHLGAAPNLDRPDEELLADLLGAIVFATGALDAHDSLITSARAAHSSLGNKHAALEAAHQAKATELGGALERREEAASVYSGRLERLPTTERPTGDDLEAKVAQRIAVLQARRRVLDKREVDRTRRRSQIDELVMRRQGLDQIRRTQVDEPADLLWNTVVAHRSALDRASEDLTTTVSLPVIEGRPTIGDLAALIQLVTSANGQLINAAQTSAQVAQASSGAARLLLSRLAADLELDADDPVRIVESTEGLTEDAALDHRRAQDDADAFCKRMPAVAALRAAGAALDDRHLALADLSAALRDGAFPKWLTLRRSRSLLVHASRLLSEITAGRYAFADLDSEDSQWFVFDSDNGQPRSPSSLSGGEKFVASLALALGMVEMMGRQGDRIESLFLDEGFGALDRTNLDAAVEALGAVAATGRLVAVITHLRAVAEQIDHVLSVTREPTGTQAVWLSDPARSVLAEGDLSVSSGLLE